MTTRLCKNVKVLTQPCFDKKSVVFKGKPQKQNWKIHINCDKMNK